MSEATWTVSMSVFYSLIAHFLCYRVIENMKDVFIKAGMFGKDLNKTSEEKV